MEILAQREIFVDTTKLSCFVCSLVTIVDYKNNGRKRFCICTRFMSSSSNVAVQDQHKFLIFISSYLSLRLSVFALTFANCLERRAAASPYGLQMAQPRIQPVDHLGAIRSCVHTLIVPCSTKFH